MHLGNKSSWRQILVCETVLSLACVAGGIRERRICSGKVKFSPVSFPMFLLSAHFYDHLMIQNKPIRERAVTRLLTTKLFKRILSLRSCPCALSKMNVKMESRPIAATDCWKQFTKWFLYKREVNRPKMSSLKQTFESHLSDGIYDLEDLPEDFQTCDHDTG